MSNCLFLHRDIDDHSRQLAPIHRLHRVGRVDRVRHQLFHARVAQVSVANGSANSDRMAGTSEHYLAGEELPVRVLQPTLAHCLPSKNCDSNVRIVIFGGVTRWDCHAWPQTTSLGLTPTAQSQHRNYFKALKRRRFGPASSPMRRRLSSSYSR